MKQEQVIFQPIGYIRSPFTRPEDTPRQPAVAENAEGTVEVFEQFAEGLEGLARFDRIWLLFWLDRARPFKLKVVPHGQTEERGVFATRAPSRPNGIGLSPVRLLKVESRILHVADLDVLDGTPLLDIKPYSHNCDVFSSK